MSLICRVFGHRSASVKEGTSWYRGRQRTNFVLICLRCDDRNYYPPGEPALIPDFIEWVRWRILVWRRRHDDPDIPF